MGWIKSQRPSGYRPDQLYVYCKTRKFHMQLIVTISTDEANPWQLKTSNFYDIEENCHWMVTIKWAETFMKIYRS